MSVLKTVAITISILFPFNAHAKGHFTKSDQIQGCVGPITKASCGTKTPPICIAPSCFPEKKYPEIEPIEKLFLGFGDQFELLNEPNPETLLNSPDTQWPSLNVQSIRLMSSDEDTNPTVSLQNSYAPHAYFSTVAIRAGQGETFCSGVLISREKVLTAGHCFCSNRWPREIVISHDVMDLFNPRIALPVHPKVEFFNANFCTKYDDWTQSSGDVSHPVGDLAILNLKSPIEKEIAATFLPLEPLARGDQLPYLYGIGFGVSLNREIPGQKNAASLAFFSRRCSADEQIKFGCLESSEFMTVSREPVQNHDTCFGDSGGPIVMRHVSDGDRPSDGGYATAPRLIGITSRGIADNEPGTCAKGAINVSLEHPDFAKWVENHRKGTSK